MFSSATRRLSIQKSMKFSDLAVDSARPVRRTVSLEERAALRAARKERAAKLLQAQGQADKAAGGSTSRSLQFSRWMWYAGVAVPTGLLVWGLNDEDSPPAKLSRAVGLTDAIQNLVDPLAKPSHEKLLPDWSQIPNVPKNIPVPHTLVLDLENTLVSSTWDRRYGWRHAKRPGVDKFLRELAQYYEIVLYSPSIDGIADPVVTSLDKQGCIMHRLYRDATHYTNGVHVKDLAKLNRPLRRMVVLDDDLDEVQFNPENVIKVKPFTDPTNRTDNTLERILPFLIEIARENYQDIPDLLSQYRGMDADEIADEQERRINDLRNHRERRSQQGLGAFARSGVSLPTPELLPTSSFNDTAAPNQLTAKDIAGAAPPPENADSGLTGWFARREKEKQEQQMRKMEKWNEIMLRKQKEKEEEKRS